ncbi:MAG: response regulator [Candidatus Sericytochromatia bacterium]
MLKKLFAGLFQADFEQLHKQHAQALKEQEQSHRSQLADLQLLLQSLEEECAQLRPLTTQIQQLEQERAALHSAQNQAAEGAHQAHTAELNRLQQHQQQLEEALQTAQTQQAEAEARAATETLSRQEAEQAQHALQQRLQEMEAQQAVLQTRLQQLAQSQQQAPINSEPTLIRPPSRRQKRVLIVDDAATTRALQKNMLESAGFEVFTGQDGEQGRQMMAEYVPDLVITDVEMPRMDGFELTRWIKQSAYREVPVLMVTSFSDEAFRIKGTQAGANGFVEKKSFNQTNFLQIVGQYL